MPQIFHPSTNTISRVSLFGALFLLGGVLWVLVTVQRSSYMTGQGDPPVQSVPFSHQHHVGGIGIDCRFCHTSVETSAFAGIPPTQTCMSCHSRLWSDSPTLAPVRESARTGRSLEWIRVHNLADFAYFDHSVHLAKGVACLTCHGHVDRMPLIWKSASLQMEWCLECHRHPERYLSPREAIFRMDAPGEAVPAENLVKLYRAKPRTDCSTCHR